MEKQKNANKTLFTVVFRQRKKEIKSCCFESLQLPHFSFVHEINKKKFDSFQKEGAHSLHFMVDTHFFKAAKHETQFDKISESKKVGGKKVEIHLKRLW